MLLIPSRTDTRYWHDFIMKADEVRFIKGRLYFNDGDGGAPFPSCIVVFSGYDYPVAAYPRIKSIDTDGLRL